MMKRTTQSVDDEKLAELILLLAEASAGDRSFGAVKLNKLLFFCDFLAYTHLGRPITGRPYVKQKYGPVPRDVVSVLRGLEQSGDCAIVERKYFARDQRSCVALRPADKTRFSPEELELIEDVVDALERSNGTMVSDLSHEFIGWQAADIGGEIPYETAWFDAPRDPTPEETEACIAAAAGLA